MLNESVVFIPSKLSTSKSDYWQPPKYTKVLFASEVDQNDVKKKVRDIVIFSNFLNPQNYQSYSWLVDKSFSDLTKYTKTVKDLEAYIRNNSTKKYFYELADYANYPFDISINPTKIDFGYVFEKYSKLPESSKLRQLIDFFTYSCVNPFLMNKIYNNSFLNISNTFIILETMIKSEISSEGGNRKCSFCEKRIPHQKSINLMIEEYVETRIKDTKTKSLIINAIKKFYQNRNKFVHSASYYDSQVNLLNILDNDGVLTYENEINKGHAAHMMPLHINTFIRMNLLDNLISST